MGFNNGPKLVTQGLDLLIDAADPGSYPGTGTVWTDLRSGVTGSLTGSVSYITEYYGGLTFTDSSSAVIFPGSTANYGSGSFTVEMAFKPDYIEGRHYLMSKNSGSFPNWAIYLSGSNGSGKLWSEWNVDASVSCSVSSSTTFVTGSVYQVDVRIFPASSASGIYVNGAFDNSNTGNSGGSLATTASLLIGNDSQGNTQNFSGSVYTVKTYTIQSPLQAKTNLNASATRFGLRTVSQAADRFDLLIVAGGGAGGQQRGGGGGAGGLQFFSNYALTDSVSTIIVGNGGQSQNTDGDNSSFSTLVSIGGGAGRNTSGNPGGSGGGAGGTSYPLYGGSGTTGQGYPGGDRVGDQDNTQAGGGGSSQAGTTIPNDSTRGHGGSGSYIPEFEAIGGSPAGWFGGGGGGSATFNSNFGFGGPGGGGNGGYQSDVGKDGVSNTGGGGGGASQNTVTAGKGGSGIVAIRYSGVPIALGGEITQSAGYTYHVFRTVGTSSFTIF